MQRAFDALENSRDMVWNEYATDWRHGLKTRKLQLDAMGARAEEHDAVTAALKEAIESPEQESSAWQTFDGEGGYEYRSYEGNENYAHEWNQRNPNHKGWVCLLSTALAQPVQPGPTTEQIAQHLRDRACGGSNYNRVLNHAADVLLGDAP